MKKRKSKNKKNVPFWGLIFSTLFLISCTEPMKVKIEIPVESAIKISDFKEIVVTNFFVSEAPRGFHAGKEIANFIVNDLRSTHSINVSFKEIKFEKDEKIFNDLEFWQNISGEERHLIITGTANINEENRNVVMESSPYTQYPGRRIVPMKFFVFNIKILLIDSSTGSVMSSKSFKEEKGYENPDTSIERGFMDIMQRVTNRYLKDLFQKKIEEERYIIY